MDKLKIRQTMAEEDCFRKRESLGKAPVLLEQRVVERLVGGV